jgi:hypothetical protein
MNDKPKPDERPQQDEDEFKRNLERLLKSPPKPHKPTEKRSDD